ncbi:hypothetical protein BCR41DRAFT_397799 [Lobosporangium transversale]|uniref:Uncharacterized protein n=1 Tax=Lobosporangium transversale TaxID=64571 RepID=A0A1Y2GI76_9FUNG|nr:hypothetical protein BCR41DRAFT_397799 [Lobosporangium transversale]ORZ11644.1 hypothetical protein BCR41DRAFT_397799 [Lobosporangium transversale]|eukprot:XP_021879741.1 hypothetical protein BCR41DRAFT_397799 [Lobosporangium transversale]
MFPHLSSGSPAHQRAHQHYSTCCPLDCPARRAPPHISQHYPMQKIQQGPNIDPSLLHPAFSGLFFQQRRSHTTMTRAFTSSQPQPQPQPHTSSLPPPSSLPSHPSFTTMDPARISPIFFGYSSKPQRAKM